MPCARDNPDRRDGGGTDWLFCHLGLGRAPHPASSNTPVRQPVDTRNGGQMSTDTRDVLASYGLMFLAMILGTAISVAVLAMVEG